MSNGFNLKSPVTLTPKKRVSLPFEARHWLWMFKPGLGLWMSWMASSSKRRLFYYTENLYNVIISLHWLSYLDPLHDFCSFYVSSCYFHCPFMLWRRCLSLNLVNQPLPAANFSSAASSPLSAFVELYNIRALLWVRLWLKEMLWLLLSSI